MKYKMVVGAKIQEAVALEAMKVVVHGNSKVVEASSGAPVAMVVSVEAEEQKVAAVLVLLVMVMVMVVVSI